MFIIVDTNSREVKYILEDRPAKGKYESPLLSVYVTKAEADTLYTQYVTWEPEITYHPGSILTPEVLQAGIDRQDAIKAQVQAILGFVQTLNGRSFDSLTTTELKRVLQLLLARNGMININGDIDLSDFTLDNIFSISGR